MLREIHTIQGNSKLGYLWVLIQTAFNVAVFWCIRAYAGASAPHGMPMILFLAAGFCLFNVFSSGVAKSLTAIDANKSLLTFPQVTALDVMVARILVLSTTQLLTFLLFAASDYIFGSVWNPGSLELFFFVWFISPLLSLGLGMVFTALASYFPAINQVIPLVFRVLFFVSGLFFSVSAFSQSIQYYLLFNPFFQLIEMLRVSLYSPYQVNGLSVTYIVSVTLISLVAGGFLEEFTRKRRLSA
jgi:capsular polysaccharide transport system permease protein